MYANVHFKGENDEAWLPEHFAGEKVRKGADSRRDEQIRAFRKANVPIPDSSPEEIRKFRETTALFAKQGQLKNNG